VPRRSQSREDLRTRLAEIAGWQSATRDDGKVAQELHETRALDQVYSLNEAAFFDELFHYIREIGAWPLLEDLDHKKREGAIYPFVQFVLFTIMRCVGGVQSMLATHDVLLTDEALMGVLGFNAAQVRHGSNDRGLSRRSKPVEIRGPFSYETVADNIVRIGPDRLANLFNGMIRCLAKQGVFPKRIDASLDATDDEATSTYATDDGRDVPRVTREKRPDVRANGHAKKVKVTVFGWKIWLVWEPISKIPLAMVVDDINAADNKHAYAVLSQAQENVKDYSFIRSVALDRGFLDGKLLSKIDNERIIIYIPAKSNLAITQNAREIARRAEEAASRGQTLEGCVYRERHQTVIHGSGKNTTKEIRTTSLVGIKSLPCDWWTPEGSTSDANMKSFEPKLLNASVVLRWDGAPKDADKEVVILTTNPAEDPFVAFDAYDDRSLIENTCNREAKEAWFLEHHPKRSEAGVRVHAYFVFLCMALVSAFRMYKEKTDAAERRGEDTGIARYRRLLELQNRDKVVVFIGEHFGIFRNFEFALLLGATVHDRRLMGESAETVLARYRPKPNSS
jgi:Transposase DDE domain